MSIETFVRHTAGRLYDRAMPHLPPSLAARIDYTRPSLRESWGGPLNGQRHRREIVREIFRLVDIDLIVETGTFRGTTTEFFAHVSGKPLKSVEASRRFHDYAHRRLRVYPEVELVLDDSRSFLRRLADQRAVTQQTTFFYLDAHWHEDLPLDGELRIIAQAWPRAVVMIDDFRVPGDPGYGFDDYGPGRVLSAECLPRDVMVGWQEFYPSVPAERETGARRGCVVLVSPSLSGSFTKARTLATDVMVTS